METTTRQPLKRKGTGQCDWVNFRDNHLHEHELQLSDYNIL